MKSSTKLFSLSTLAAAAMLVMSVSPVHAKEGFNKSFEQDVKSISNKAEKAEKFDNDGFGSFGRGFPTAVQSVMEVDGDHVDEQPEKVAERLGKIPHVSRAMPSSSIKQGNFVQQIARTNPVATTTTPAAYQPTLVQPTLVGAGGGYTPASDVIASGNGTPGAFNYGLYYETFNRYAPGDPGATLQTVNAAAPYPYMPEPTYAPQPAPDVSYYVAAPEPYDAGYQGSYAITPDLVVTGYAEPGISGYDPSAQTSFAAVDPAPFDMTYYMEGGNTCDSCTTGYVYTGNDGGYYSADGGGQGGGGAGSE